MSERRGPAKLRVARWMQPAVGVLLAVIVLIIAGYLAVRIARTSRVRPVTTDIGEGKVDVKQGVRVYQFKGDKGRIDVRGDRSIPLDEKQYRLEGHVEVVDRGRKGGREIRMSADSLDYDKDMTRYTLRGGVRVLYKALVLESPDFDYDRAKDVIATTSGGKIVSPKLEGSAKNITFYPKDEVVILEGDLTVTLRSRLSSDVPLVMTGDRFRYDFSERRGDIDRNIDLVHGRSRGRANRAHLEQFDKTDDFRVLELGDGVRLDLEGELQAAPKSRTRPKEAATGTAESAVGRDLSLGESVRQEITAETLRLQAFDNAPILEKAAFTGRASVRFIYATGAVTEIQGEAVGAVFGRGGDLRELTAKTGARITSRDKDGTILRVIEGGVLLLDNDKRVLTASGIDSAKARFVSARSDVSAGTIAIMTDSDDFTADGGVRTSFQADPATAAKKGFFSAERPVFATARTMRFLSRVRRFSLMDPADRVRCWQDTKVLSAKEIGIAEDGGDLAANGSVQTVFPHKPKESEPERQIKIEAGQMRFEPETNQVVYEDNCVLRTGAAVLTCGRITVDPGEGGGEVRSMRAVKGKAPWVVIIMNNREATGEVAEYDVPQDTIVVTGQPILKDKDKGEVRGDKLTFQLSDGIIRVQDRSVTTIKS